MTTVLRSPIAALFRRLVSDRRAIAATEFALVSPLLLTLLGVSIEIGRFMLYQRNFEQCVAGVGRHVSRYPVYGTSARNYAVPIAAALFPEGAANLDLSVTSLSKTEGKMQPVFPTHVLFGSDPGIAWQDRVDPDAFVEGEGVIFVAARYTYRPMFSELIDFEKTFSKSYELLPNFSRRYVWSDLPAGPDVYVWSSR